MSDRDTTLEERQARRAALSPGRAAGVTEEMVHRMAVSYTHLTLPTN